MPFGAEGDDAAEKSVPLREEVDDATGMDSFRVAGDNAAGLLPFRVGGGDGAAEPTPFRGTLITGG